MIRLSFCSCSLSKVESEQYFDCFSEKCLSFLAMTSWKGRRCRAFNFLFNLPSTLISLLLYFRIIFGFAPPALPVAICKRDICHMMAFKTKRDLLAESIFNEFKI